MNYSENGRKATEGFEGLRLTSYQDSVGVWTIGYGHTSGVHAGMTCTAEQADQWLQEDIQGAVYVVNKVVTVPLNQNQFDALVDFVFNLGSGNFQNSTLLKLLNQGNYQGAANEFPKWNHAGGVVVAGLTKRRNAEMVLFNTPVNQTVSITTPQTPQETTVAAAPVTLTQQLQSWVQSLKDKFGK